jgi:DNA repair protein RAD16
MEDDDVDFTVPVPATNEEPPTYIVEVAKSGRAECKKCENKIDNKAIRVGVLVDGEWGLFTRWQHLHCTVFHKSVESAESLDGYQELTVEQKADIQKRVEESANEVDEDSLPVDPDELVRKAWDKPVEPSPDLLMPLLPYQKEGLGWMINQEMNDTHGGILADEMGMGKTIQAISLMLANRPNFSDFGQMREWAASDERHCAEPGLTKASTLIVLPTVAIRQWQTEIARFTRNGSLTVKVYHGSDRNTTVEDLTSVDVVLTSYKVSFCCALMLTLWSSCYQEDGAASL